MNFKQIIQDYFTFNRNERKGITILLVIIFLLAVANKVIFYFETPAKIDTALLDSARQELELTNDLTGNSFIVGKLFAFNPNTIEKEALDSLWLPQTVKRNILKYREKGGMFYSENDFKKIFGVTDSIFSELKPYLVFENETKKTIREKARAELFPFDPNTSGDNDFMRLGFSEKQIKTIRNFQSKGGTFKSKNDFFKIYGITESQKKTLGDYVIIQEKATEKLVSNMDVIFPQVEVNSADSADLMKLPGIGTKLSIRIIKYRELLGGFHSVTQLKEVYGLSEQVFQKIEGLVKIDPEKINKVDLNFSEWNDLAKHPYIQKARAQQIIKFRTKYGSIQDPSVLRDSMVFNIDEYARIKPYL